MKPLVNVKDAANLLAAAALSIAPRKRTTKPGNQRCGPSAAFWPSK
jgi:hypothetical protein